MITAQDSYRIVLFKVGLVRIKALGHGVCKSMKA